MEMLWLVGQVRGKDWEFQGVFSTEEKAIQACRNRNYFIAPIEVDTEAPDSAEPFPLCEYPLR